MSSMLARQEGYIFYDDPMSRANSFESGTLTCNHCNQMFVRNLARTRPRSTCRNCRTYICDKCAGVDECYPFWQRIEDEQTKIIHQEIAAKL